MNPKILIYCLLVLGCVSCVNKHEENSSYIDLDKKAKEDKVSYSDFFKKIAIIPLETTNESGINRIDKIVRDNDKFFILDKKQKAILIFNQRGKFIKKLKQIGKGPGEYQYLQDFEINRFTKNIELLEPWGTISVYDTLFNFVERYRLPSSVRAVHFLIHVNRDTIAFYTTSQEKRLTFFSKKQNEIIKQYHEIPEWLSSNTPLNGKSPFSLYNDTINFYEVFSNDVFYIENCELKLKYSWNFGKNNFSYKDLPGEESQIFYKKYFKNVSYAYNFFYNIENERYIITMFIFNKKTYTFLLDKKTNKHFLFNEFKEGIGFYTNDFFEKGCYSVVEMEYLKLVITKPELLENENQIIYNNLKPENNPIVVEYYF